ncbi:putative transporter YutK [Rhynchophorus ferrugineus]|uniref:putative transporter YutK n=1 Tax=Rhynchophorus ferrugineus TaxID=354439 RepID=UPI003FCC27FC
MTNTNSTENIIKADINSDHMIEVSGDSTEEKKNLLKIILRNKAVIKVLIFCFITAYAVWATIHFVKNTDPLDSDAFVSSTTNGYGLLVILYIIYVWATLYYNLLKPRVWPTVHKTVWSPTTKILHQIRYGSLIFYISVLVATLAFLIFDTSDNRNRLIPLIGLLFFLAIAFVFSANHRRVPWDTIIWGIILQFIFGFLTIRWSVGRNTLKTFSDHVNTFLDYGVEGAAFTYGDELVNVQKVFAFQALSVIFFMGFVINILYYYGLMQRFVNMLGECLHLVMGTTICESVNSVAVAFVGMSEGPMMLRPYLKYLTDSEIHSMLLAGFASVSGSTFAAYITYGARPEDLVTASIMSAPSALCFSKILYPEVQEVRIKKKDVHMVEVEYSSVIDAASKGATDAYHLIAAIISGVTATLSFIYFINGVLQWLGILVGFTEESNMWSLQLIAGKIFIPIAWIMGVPWEECEKVAQLIGIKTMVNEFVAFKTMGNMDLMARTKVIATYAICGFSNPGSIGIMVSTMAALVPEKRDSVNRLIFRAWVGGALVCFMTACIAGLLMTDDALSTSNSTPTSLGNHSNNTLTFLS